MAALGLCCCMQAFSSCGEQGLLFVVVCGLLVAVASRCGAWALRVRTSVVAVHGLSSCGARAQLLCGMWDLPGPEIKPLSPASTGRFLTTALPGKSRQDRFFPPPLREVTPEVIRSPRCFCFCVWTLNSWFKIAARAPATTSAFQAAGQRKGRRVYFPHGRLLGLSDYI